ncbi:MAG TPA: glucose-1-phosphate adenylyltransferase [Ruminococcaceae bacterium]|nr:glucose-1-phosphate adenylyltransferase [Oscillospiraceae bacterium]HBJ10378.1 glucose-1-phosphate adenylyltransferase [Oscillospiraceae bacterium]
MLLAGGQGSRLGVLTSKIAKPAVPYGGKYRIIDFPLSNCANSGIDTVGILTQYKPLELNDYVGSGKPWDLDRTNGGVHILPPYQGQQGGNWYKGTANAIYQNLEFIERYEPEYVLVLSGDHIYKMDYSKMIKEHEETGAACTIAVLEVPLEEASRFGIMNTKEDGTIYEFEEKPKNPKSNLASMGIYVFTWKKLKKYLTEDEAKPDSSNDFGKDVIPAMLNAGELLRVYRFNDYWKDVGTVNSLWEANLDLLNPKIDLNLADQNWRIYSRTTGMPPQYISESADVENSLITDGCEVYGRIDYSVLFENVTVEEGADVEYSLVMPGAVIKKGAKVKYSIIAENAVIGEDAAIGEDPAVYGSDNWGITVIGDKLKIGKKAIIKPDRMITKDVAEEEVL